MDLDFCVRVRTCKKLPVFRSVVLTIWSLNAFSLVADSTSAEGGKLLRDKHIEERKRKNAERKAAVEDRRKQKEIEDNARHETFRHLLEHKPSSKASGRKLPSVPNNGPAHSRRETPATRRISSSSSSSEGHTPPESDKGSRNARRNLTGPTSASTSSLNSFGSTARPRTNLGASKKASISTNCLNEKSSGAKAGQRGKDKGTGAGAPARRSVGSSIPKAQSMGAIHQVGHSKTSRPPTGKKAKPKAKPTHHAGTSSEAEAGKALAEHRKKMREEAERKALLDKQKQEELRRQREEEEKRLAEENGKKYLSGNKIELFEKDPLGFELKREKIKGRIISHLWGSDFSRGAALAH